MPKGSSILIITSTAGFTPSPMLGAYSVSKTALLGLIKTLSLDLTRFGIRINGIAPGTIKTKFAEMLWKNETVSKIQLEGIPMQRFGVMDDIGGAGAFLCSDDSAYMTGETLVIGGGITSRL